MTDHYPADTTRPVHPQDPRTPSDRGATVVNNGRSGSAGWAIALLVAVALGIAAVFMFTDFSLTGHSVDEGAAAPTSSAPADPAPAAPAAPAPSTGAAPSTDAAPPATVPSTGAAPSTGTAPATPAPSAPAPAGQ
jgi:hypothetical protein